MEDYRVEEEEEDEEEEEEDEEEEDEEDDEEEDEGVTGQALLDACLFGNISFLEDVVEKYGSKVDQWFSDGFGRHCSISALLNLSSFPLGFETFQWSFLKFGHNPNYTSFACSCRNWKVLDFLMEHEVNLSDGFKSAIWNGHFDVIEYLWNRGFSPQKEDWKRTPIHPSNKKSFGAYFLTYGFGKMKHPRETEIKNMLVFASLNRFPTDVHRLVYRFL
jgi:hypothetical protein